MHDAILKTVQIEKSFPQSGFKLGPVDLELRVGETVAVFGKNGAGKSTFFQLVTGNLDPSAGVVLLDGKKLTPEKYELKRAIGYLPQNLDLPDYVTGKEILLYATKLYGFADQKEVVRKTLAYWDCASYQHKPLATLSHGMQKRIGLALATLHTPPLLILDEPFSGLDIMHMQALNQVLFDRHKAGLATIVSTHVVPYAAKLCQKAVLMQNGQLVSLPAWDHQDYLTRIDDVESRFQ